MSRATTRQTLVVWVGLALAAVLLAWLGQSETALTALPAAAVLGLLVTGRYVGADRLARVIRTRRVRRATVRPRRPVVDDRILTATAGVVPWSRRGPPRSPHAVA